MGAINLFKSLPSRYWQMTGYPYESGFVFLKENASAIYVIPDGGGNRIQ
jgi:hypothetical protein